MKFGARSTAGEVVAGHDLRGRDAIVTGATSGIGVETVRALATAGARIVLAARDRVKAESVAATLRKETGHQAIEVGLLDLASLASVRVFAEQFLTQRQALHLLINNAGVGMTPQSYTVDGFELQFGTNHVGHFALTVGLLPALKAARTARVVALTSRGHYLSNVHFEDLNFYKRPYDKWSTYGQSKTANALFAVGVTQRYASDGITANAVHPGRIRSGMQRHLSQDELIKMGFFDKAGGMNPALKSAEQGAATSIWAAVAPELTGIGGHYLENCAIAQPWTTSDIPEYGYVPYALDPNCAQRLWSVSEELIAR